MQTTNAFDYPQEPILLVRPCLVVICRENRPAAKLLSGLLYHARNCQPDQETFIYQRKQEDLVKIDLCGEISTKTLHDVAIPALKLLGFIEVDESSYVMRYTVYLSRVRQSLAAYKQGKEPLEKILIDFIKQQLEKVLIQLEKFLIDKKNFQLLLEKFLNVIRKISNSRGRKGNAQANSEAPEINRDYKRYKGDNRESGGGSASATPAPSVSPSQETTQGSPSPSEPPIDSSSHESETNAEDPEQPELLEVEPGPLTKPDVTAKWCAKTAVALSEFLRGKRYTDVQAPNQLKSAQKMFKTFPGLTRTQFEAAFLDWLNWWREHDKGIFTLAELMAKKYGSQEIRLSATLDRMEATQQKPATPVQQPQPEADAEREARNKRNQERSRQGAIQALQARIERNSKFQPFELEMMVEQFGMTLPPHLLSQYQSRKAMALSQ